MFSALKSLGFQVRQLQEDAVRLQSAYAGDKADDIQKREGEVSGETETAPGFSFLWLQSVNRSLCRCCDKFLD